MHKAFFLRLRMRHAVFFSLGLSVLPLVGTAGMTVSGRLIRTPTHIETSCGFPFPWLVFLEPHPRLARTGVDSQVQCRIPILLLDWCIWFLLPFIPLTAFIAHRSRLRRDPNRCAYCGYLLVGLEIPRCPECGREFDRSCLGDECPTMEGVCDRSGGPVSPRDYSESKG